MDLFWTNMDYLGSDSSGLESVWIYSGPIRIPNQNFWPPLVINPDQIVLGWGQCGFILDQIWIMLGQVILVWDRYGFILDQYGLCWIR